MNLEDFVIKNQKIIELVKDRVGGKTDVDMYYGTLDYATARFNTILLKLSQVDQKILSVNTILFHPKSH